MNRWTLSLIFLLGFGTGFTQSPKIDSLKVVLNTAKSDTIAMQVLFKLASQYKNVNKDSMIIRAKQGLRKAYDLGNPKWIGHSHLKMARFHYYRNENDLLVLHTKKADSIYAFLGIGTKQMDARYLQGAALYQQQKRQETIDHCIETIKMIYEKQLENKIPNKIGQLHQLVAASYNSIGEPVEALIHHHECLRIFEEQNKTHVRVATHNNIANVYQTMMSYDIALEHYKKALDLLDTLAHPNIHLDLIFNIGMLKLRQGDISSALTDYYKALKIGEQVQQPCEMGYIKGNIGLCLIKQGNFESAISFIDQAVNSANKCDNNLYRTTAYFALGELNTKLKKDNLAKEAFSKSLMIARRIDEHDFISKSSLALYELNLKKKHFEQASQHLAEYLQSRDSVLNTENIAKLAYQESEFYFEKKEKALAVENEKEQIRLEEKATKERIIYISLSSFLMMVLVSGYVIYQTKVKSNKRLREKNNLIEAQNIKIEESALKEKQLLEAQIQSRDRELASYAMQFNERNNTLKKLEDKISTLVETSENSQGELKNIKKMIQSNLDHQEDAWDNFMSKFEEVYPKFFEKIKSSFDTLTLNQLKICAYLKVGMDNRDIANVSHIEMDSVKKNIFRIKKKMVLGPDDSIRDFLISYN
ncbi:MAG: tetratricopeptide repeat protein [Reichenbachiella sp.]